MKTDYSFGINHATCFKKYIFIFFISILSCHIFRNKILKLSTCFFITKHRSFLTTSDFLSLDTWIIVPCCAVFPLHISLPFSQAFVKLQHSKFGTLMFIMTHF